MEAGLLELLGLKLKVVFASAAGAFISLKFFEGLGLWERWTTFVGGWVLGSYMATPVTTYLELSPAVELGIGLAIALFGMSIAAALIKVIRGTDWIGMFKRKTGGE